ncbi:MAG: transporter [Pseudomonadales bacterium]|jgi:hypothetical protein|nr:transporter [Pseudomonadales bacterium]
MSSAITEGARRSPGAASLLIGCLLASTTTVCSAAPLARTLSLGGEFTSGDYGGDDTIEDIYVPLTLGVRGQRLAARVTVPWASVTAPEGSIFGQGEVVPGSGSDRTESGLGDVLVSGSVLGLVERDAFVVDLTGKVKLPTADENDGLGTGEADYSAQFDGYLYQGELVWFGTVGYKWRGDPSGFSLDDTWFASGGGSVWLKEGRRVGASLSYRPELIDGGNEALDLALFLDTALSADRWLQLYGLAGLADGSPDWGLGASMTLRF